MNVFLHELSTPRREWEHFRFCSRFLMVNGLLWKPLLSINVLLCLSAMYESCELNLEAPRRLFLYSMATMASKANTGEA